MNSNHQDSFYTRIFIAEVIKTKMTRLTLHFFRCKHFICFEQITINNLLRLISIVELMTKVFADLHVIFLNMLYYCKHSAKTNKNKQPFFGLTYRSFYRHVPL